MSRSPDVTVCVRPSALLTPALFLLLTDTPILLAALLPAALLHELAHYAVLHLCGVRTARFTLTGLGASLYVPELHRLSYGAELLSAAAGPLMNLLLWVLLSLTGREELTLFAGAQMVLGVLNLLTGPEQLSIGKNRMKGYLKAMTLNKLEINTDYIVRCEDFSVKAAKEATQRLLNMKNMPDAIFGINDDMAIGAIEAIKEKGLKIPEEVAVLVFSNSKRSRNMTPSVSTINQFPEKIGETAAELLFEQILDAKHAQIREEVINSELIVRESSDRSFMQ